uniref:ARAD1B12474p n=1 Tax=Blastobotrys adeninivorans TaxID=409370 RepID=A0A060T5K7_BLAAD
MKLPVPSVMLSLVHNVLGESPSSGQQACASLNTDQFVGYSGFVVHQEFQIRQKGLNNSQPSIGPSSALASTANTVITQCAHGDPVATIPVTGALWNQTYCSQDGEAVCVRLARRRVGLIERSYNNNKSGQKDASATNPAFETNESADDEQVELPDISGSDDGRDDALDALDQSDDGTVESSDPDRLDRDAQATPPDSDNITHLDNQDNNPEEDLTDPDHVQSADEPEPKNNPLSVGVNKETPFEPRRLDSDAADPIDPGTYDDGPEVETAGLPSNNNPGSNSGTNGAVGGTLHNAHHQFFRLGNSTAGSSRIARASARLSSVYGAVFQCPDGEDPEHCQAVVPLARVSTPELITRRLWWAVESGQTLTSQQQHQQHLHNHSLPKWSSSRPTLRLHRVIMYSPDQLDRRYPHHDRWTQLLSPVELY